MARRGSRWPGAVLGESAEPPWAGLAAGPPGRRAEDEQDEEAANPFSFQEFVRSKRREAASASAAAPWRGSPEGSLSSSLPPDEALREPSPFTDSTVASDSLPDEDEDEDEDGWSSTYQPSAVEEAAHRARAPGPSDPFACHLPDLQAFCPEQRGGRGRVPWGSFGEGGHCWRGDQTPPEGDLHQLRCEDLRKENSKLRSKMSQIQAVSESQAERIRQLERTLEMNKRTEEKEINELEAMVQQVEENLQLMTKRAMKAENAVIKLKQENMHLQVQVGNYQLEKIALRSGHLESLTVVKQNADAALQNLLAVITKSKSSIKLPFFQRTATLGGSQHSTTNTIQSKTIKSS